MKTDKNRFKALDAFRGICACLVALSHFNADSILSGYTLVDFGSVYVDFFFVLSGFVIFANYQDRLINGFSIRKFMFLRFFRLYPLHFCVLMGFIFIDVFQEFIHIKGAALYPPFSAPGETHKDIVANLLLVHSLHVSKDIAFNGPSWSISVEFYTYLLFAFILSVSGKLFKPAIFLTGLCGAVLVYSLNGELYAKLDYGFFRCVYGFACGALIWNLRMTYKDRIHAWLSKNNKTVEFCLIISIILFIQFLSLNSIASMATPLIFSLCVLVFSFETGAVSGVLKKPILQFLGKLSYSIYMLHLFIDGKFFELPARLAQNRLHWNFSTERGGVRFFGTNLLTGTLFEILYLCVVVGCSYISFRLIEEPFRLWSKRKASKGADLPTVQGAI